MKIAVYGAGSIGGVVGELLSNAGHQVVFTGRNQEAARTAAAGAGAESAPVEDALGDAEVVVLAIPFEAFAGVASEYGDKFEGKVIIDPSNAMHVDERGITPIDLPPGTTSSEVQQLLFPRATVVKAFSHFVTDELRRRGIAGQDDASARTAMFIAGDRRGAVAIVTQLVNDAGFFPVSIGQLAGSRYLHFTDLDFIAAQPMSPDLATVRAEQLRSQ